MQQLSASQVNAEVPLNENFETLEHQSVYGKDHAESSGLTWGYYGGMWADAVSVADGTLSLTASSTNYVVVHRTTGAITVSTSNTHWNDTATYARVYKITTNASGPSATEDHRVTTNGIFAGGGAVGGVDAEDVAITDTGAYFTATDVEGALQEIGDALDGFGTGDASTNTSSSVDSEVALFSGTGGKTLKRATGSGLVKLTSGVMSIASAGTDYQAADADLTTIAGLTPTTDNFIQAKSSAWASRTVAQVSADLQATGLVTDAVGFRTIPQNSQSTAYTTVAADSGKHLLHPSSDANARTFTIDSNANVAYPVGTAITFINQTSQVLSIAITSDTLTLANSTTTGTRSLAQNGVATAIKVASTSWIISGAGLT
jgi:hypothetical protein